MKLSDLSPQIQEIISDQKNFESFLAIGNSYNLHIDTTGEIYDEMVLLFHGDTASKDFVNNVKKRTGLDDATLYPIINDINEKILRPIKQKIVEATNKDLVEELSHNLYSPVPSENHSSLKAEHILDEIENPAHTPSALSTYSRIKQASLVEGAGINLIEQKLTKTIAVGPASANVEKVTQEPPLQTTSTTPKVDPYREQV